MQWLKLTEASALNVCLLMEHNIVVLLVSISRGWYDTQFIVTISIHSHFQIEICSVLLLRFKTNKWLISHVVLYIQWASSWARTGSDRLGSVQPGSDQANVRAMLQNLSVPETQSCFMTRSTMESSSFMLIIIWSLPGHFIIADISSKISRLVAHSRIF